MLTIIFLVVVIILIVVAITYWKLHPFITLLLAGVLIGILSGPDTVIIMAKLTEGFGSTLKSIGIVIALGTIIGTFLERSGGARTMADFILRIVGGKRSPLAMSITGFIVSIPVFCDSGFVILSTLNKALSKKTGVSLSVLAIALATGLYTTHVFVPPTPGPLAAAATLGADIGLVILFGLIVSIPTAAAGLIWAQTYCKKFEIIPEKFADNSVDQVRSTGPGGAFGMVLRASGVGDTLGQVMSQWQLGIFLPFLIAAVLKSAQGSSTVAIITTAALMTPLLEPLGLVSPIAKALVVLAIGAGSMTVSHLNDSYFWVIAQFSDLDTATALRCHSVATLIQRPVYDKTPDNKFPERE